MDGAGEVPDQPGTGASSPYIDPGTDFLRNEVSATSQEEMNDASAELLPERLEDLADAPIRCTGDRAHLQAIHRVLFDGVFEWAGEFRTTDIDKQGTDFVSAARSANSCSSAVSTSAAAAGGDRDRVHGIPAGPAPGPP